MIVEYAVLVDMVNPVSAVGTSTCSYCTLSTWMHTQAFAIEISYYSE